MRARQDSALRGTAATRPASPECADRILVDA
jgi:hypothetical protein